MGRTHVAVDRSRARVLLGLATCLLCLGLTPLASGAPTGGGAACPYGAWQYSLENISELNPSYQEHPFWFAGSVVELEFRCKYGDLGRRYGLNVCVRQPSGALGCSVKAVWGDRWGGTRMIRTTPWVAGVYRWSVARRPGAPVIMRSHFRTYAGE